MKPKKSILKVTSLIAGLMAFAGLNQLNAQLIPSTAIENVYPGWPVSGDHPSCYSYQNQLFAGGNLYDTYVSAVNASFIYRFTPNCAPTSIITQGTISYPNAIDINVG